MYKEINEQLMQSQQKVQRLHKIEAMLAVLREDCQTLDEAVGKAKAVFEKESKDYEKLTKTSISSIFHTILGNLAEKSKEERHHAAEAELKYKQTVLNREDAYAQIAKLEAEMLQYENAQTQYNEAYNEKFQMLVKQNDKTAQAVMDLFERMEASEGSLVEIDEAVRAGQAVMQSLGETAKSLDSAEGWGVFDMLGGGLITDVIKHSHIDDASEAAERTQSLLRHFRAELADINLSEDIKLHISGFARFADFFFDGLIADWFVQKQINTTQESVRAMQEQVKSVMAKLDVLSKAEQQNRATLHEQISRLVVEA